MRRSLVAWCLLLSVAACDSDPAEPEAVVLQVKLQDSGGLNALFNQDDIRCRSTDFASEFTGRSPEPVSVTVRDASSVIVATQQLPEIGGFFNRPAGCTWPLTFELETDNFWEVSVEDDGLPGGSVRKTVQRAGAETEVTIIF